MECKLISSCIYFYVAKKVNKLVIKTSLDPDQWQGRFINCVFTPADRSSNICYRNFFPVD